MAKRNALLGKLSEARNALLSRPWPYTDPRAFAQGMGTAPSQEAANVGASFLPGIGDAVGFAQDVGGMYTDPRTRTPLNGLLTLAALLPGIPTRVYHGTPAVFDDFSQLAPKQTLGGLSKHGISVSEEATVANRYATMSGKGAPNVRALEATVAKPLSLTAQEFHKLQGLVGKIDRGEPLSELEDVGLEMLLNKYGIKYGGHPIQAIKDAGYDAIQGDAGRFGAAETEALIFDPSKLTTKWGK